MKTTNKLLAVSIIFTLMLITTYSCKDKKPQPQSPYTPAEVPENTADIAPPQKPMTKADLAIQSVKLEKAAKADKWYTHTLIVEVRNNGESVAKGFNLGCTYNCPAGLTKSAGANVVQGGYIAGNSKFIYKSMFHIHCDGPPAFLDLKFEIDPQNKVVESNENNNVKRVRVTVPF